MTATKFHQIWVAHYAKSPPLSYLLRQAYPERWLRIHSLPNAQRYPVDAADWAELLQRQRTVLTDLLGKRPPLIVTGYYSWSDEAAPTDPLQFFAGLNVFATKHFLPLGSYPLEPSPQMPEEKSTYWPLLVLPITRLPDSEPLIQAIALDKCRALFINSASGIVIAPYDGGIDIFLTDKASRDQYKSRCRAWLSARQDGL